MIISEHPSSKRNSKISSPIGDVKQLVQQDSFLGQNALQDDQEKVHLAGFGASYVNLVKTIIGAGILVLPSALMRLGLVLGLVMMFVAAALCILGLHLLNVAAMQVGRKASFSGLCAITYPQAAFVFEFAIAIKCIGAGISYMSIAGETSSELAKQLLVPSGATGFIWSLLASKMAWTFLVAALITPICLMRKMDSLKYTSFGGLVAVAYLVALTVWNFFRIPEASFTKIPLFVEWSFGMCSAYSVFVFAFTCHQNILPIQNEAKDNTPSGMMGIMGPSIGTSYALYLIVSIIGAATYGSKIDKVILNSFPDDMAPFIIARFMYVCLLVLSFPLQVFPCRMCIEKMTGTLAPAFLTNYSKQFYLITTMSIITIASFVGSLDYPVDKALGWVGATAGTFICYFLPAIIYNKLYMGTRMDWRRISAIVLFIAGCFTLVLAVTGLIKS
jgi:amino acid permease